ncbi:hypothetical protein A3759_15905 [Thalassolituus sp. HI0120]|nr:hypothetical protein A3759_15905 [Thalassolituus sp. HI0120]
MDLSKINEYRKSIKFELIRAKLASDEFFGYAGGFITEKFDDSDVLAKIKRFDAYARWVGHLYESLLALVKIEDQNYVSENSRWDVTDAEIQLEAKKSLNRFNTLVKSGEIDSNGYVSLSLEPDFSSDLRKARNKCSFHCTDSRVQSDILQDFMNKHHHMAYWLYSEMLNLHGKIDESSQDLGAIDQFFASTHRMLS